MQQVGQVVIGQYRLSAECLKCGKSVKYNKGTNETTMSIEIRVAQFVKEHKNCKANKS